MSDNISTGFDLLHPLIQKWIWDVGWVELREIQEQSIRIILEKESDLIITANTAAGKTEAAYLPILSSILDNTASGIRVVYISPLKALINDQFERLELLCEKLDLKVTPWHGDIVQSRKQNLIKKPEGLLLITPESLEAIFVLHGNQIRHLFEGLTFFLIDELHTFLDSERGKQIHSLINRMDFCLNRRVRRVALSATLGDMKAAQEYLNVNTPENVEIIDSSKITKDTKLEIRGYLSKPPDIEEPKDDIIFDLFKISRGSDNLLFANRKSDVEYYADCLRRICENNNLPQEFMVHHGSLSKELRTEVETRLKQRNIPTNVVCTSTLELGIDIGSVKSIAQIGCPISISSMKQRLGRSGRRDNDPSIIRIFIKEESLTNQTHIQDELRAKLFQATAMVELMIQKWLEPPDLNDLHLSTLIHQILSLISQYGGIKANQAFNILVTEGSFNGINQKTFVELLRFLGEKKLISQMSDGTLVHGALGEQIVNHYTFYAVFETPEEYRLIAQNKTIGTIPVSNPIMPDSYLIFAGKRWLVTKVDEKQKIIELKLDKGGKPPQFDTDYGLKIHKKVRDEMLRLYSSNIIPPYLNKGAINLFDEGKQNFVRYGLDKSSFIEYGSESYFFPWESDKVMNTLCLMLIKDGIAATNEGICIHIKKKSESEIRNIFLQILSQPKINPMTLLDNNQKFVKEKYDKFVPPDLLLQQTSMKELDIDSTYQFIEKFITRTE